MKLTLNRRGEVRSERIIAACQKPVRGDRLAAKLEKQGYERVRIVQGRKAPYLVRGCFKNKRVELIVDRYGEVLSKTGLGDCRRLVDPAKLASYLESEGYDRMNPIQIRKAPYRVEACKAANLMELVIGRAGRIRSKTRVGRCNTLSSEQDILAKLSKRGVTSSSVKRTSRGHWMTEGCKNETRVEVRFSRYGEVQGERNLGSCASAKVRDALETLRSRGAKNVTMFVQGCFNNNTYHWVFDNLGNRTDRRFVQSGC